MKGTQNFLEMITTITNYQFISLQMEITLLQAKLYYKLS